MASFLISVILTISPSITAYSCKSTTVCDEIGFQYEHTQCGDGEGGIFIVWSDGRNGIDLDIYAQRIDVNGDIMWEANNTAICTESGNQGTPKICSAGVGGAIIVWSDGRSGGAGAGIYAQRIKANGSTLWNANGSFVSTGGLRQLFSDNNGGAVFTLGKSIDTDYYAQRVSSNGTALWGSAGAVICNATDSQEDLQFFCDEEGNSYFTWHDYREGEIAPMIKESDIYAQKIDINGNVLWQFNGTAVCTLNGSQWYPQICTDGMGGAIINWIDLSRGQCFFQRLNSTRESQWEPNGTALLSSVNFLMVNRMISDGGGGAIIIIGGTGSGLYALRINSSAGLIYFNEFYTNENGGILRHAQICSDGEGGYFIAWEEPGLPQKKNVVAQRINGNGINIWSLNGKVVCDSLGDQVRISITNNGVGKAIISWETWLPDSVIPTDKNIYYTILKSGNETSIPFGNTYLLFAVLSILTLVFIVKRYPHQNPKT
ncbi:MAG: hypothetical protein KGD58_06710 [Candidatus Lokiarchaeota archaeon]|nr:hypothetical protein [Candidatus Lokiarchaeota archaeon]